MEPIPTSLERCFRSESPREPEQLKVGSSPLSAIKIMKPRSLRTMRQKSNAAEKPVLDHIQPAQEHHNQQRQKTVLFLRIGSLSRSRSLTDEASLTTPSFTVTIHDEQATPYTMITDHNPFLSKTEEYNEAEERQQEDDDVSSISNDSARRFNLSYAAVDLKAPPLGPPAEIVLRNISPASHSITPPVTNCASSSNSPVAIMAPIHSTTILPLWQQNSVQGENLHHQEVKKQQESPVASVKTAPMRPPQVITNICTSSPIMTARPMAPRHMASSTAFTHISSPRLPVNSPLSPSRLLSDNVCGSSVDNGLLLDKMLLSPDRLCVNTETTAPMTPTLVGPAVNNTSPTFDHRSVKGICKPKVITQRRATTGAVDMIPSASLPLITGSRHCHGRRQHEHENDSGSVQPSRNCSSSVHRVLLGDRHRHKEIMGAQSVFTFRSTVGQSSSILMPTSITSGSRLQGQTIGSPSREFSQIIKANQRREKVCGAETSASAMQRSDLELLRQRSVAQPLRWLTGTEDDSVARFYRSSTGCLA